MSCNCTLGNFWPKKGKSYIHEDTYGSLSYTGLTLRTDYVSNNERMCKLW